MKQIKILYIITSLEKGGAETQLFRLVSNLKKKKNVKLKIIALSGGYFENKLKKENIKVEILSNKINYLKLPKYIFRLKKIIEDYKPNIVHSFLFHTNILAKLSLFFMKKNSLRNNKISSEHFKQNSKSFKLITSYRADIRDFKLLYFLERINKNKVDIAISNTKAAFDGMNKLFQKPSKKVISNGIEISDFSKIKPNLELKKKFKNKKIVLTVANFRDEKDYITNVNTCQELLKKRSDFVFLYIGIGPNFDTIKKLVSDLNLEKKIIFLKRRDDVISIMKISDVFFLPTKCEGQSNVMLEAMSVKLPVVTTNIDAVVETKADFFYSNVGDFKKMAEEINKILDGNFNKDLLNKNYKLVKENYSIKSMVENYYGEYKSLIQKDK